MTLKRACSLLTVKSFSEDERVITGIASTPSPDRDGDILEPEGAEAVRSRFSGSMTIPVRWGSVRCAGSAKGWKSRQHW